MRRLFAASLCLVCAPPALAAPAPEQSWGKAGISLDQYRQDALDCGRQGYYLDISQTEDAKEFVKASKQLDALNGSFTDSATVSGPTGPASTNTADQMARFAITQQHVIDSVRPDQRYRSLKKTLQGTTDQCLVERGYSRFTLTDEQRHRLRKLKFGSDERRTYLYSLASDPAVLEGQKVVAQP